MNKKQIINAMLKTVDLRLKPIFSCAIPANNDFIFTNRSIAIFDSENPANLPLLDNENNKSIVEGISKMFDQKPYKSIYIDRKKIDDFIKANKLRNGYGQNINLKCGEMYFCYNAKYLWWILDYCKSDYIEFVDSGVDNHFTAVCTGDDCKALLLPVRINKTPNDNIFVVEDSLAEISKKIKGFKAENAKIDNEVETPKKVTDNEKTSVSDTLSKTDNQTIGTIATCLSWEELITVGYKLCEQYKNNKSAIDKIHELFNAVYPSIKDSHYNAKGEYHIQETKETPAECFNIIKTIANLDGVNLQMVGRFMWTGGRKQKENARILKSLGFTFQENKSKFCRSYIGYVRADGKKFSWNKIKSMYGVVEENTI